MMIRAYVMDVNEQGVVYSGCVDEIDNDTENIEQYVGGVFTKIPLQDDIVIIIREDNENNNLPVNRAIVKEGEIVNILRGKVVCVRSGHDGLSSVKDDDIDVIRKYVLPVFELDGEMHITQ